MSMNSDLLLLFASFAVSALGVGLMFFYLTRTGVLIDVPNHRSSHCRPTPRGGGLALAASVVCVSVSALRTSAEQREGLLLILAAIILVTSIGFLDDRRSVPVAARLAVHVLCGVAIALAIGGLPSGSPVTYSVLFAWWMIWTVSAINVVNFMDGIDGMVASQGAVYGVFLFALNSSDTIGARFGLVFAGACLGFLVWNWAPARIFLGDVGSGALGLFVVVGGALSVGSVPFLLIVLPLFPLFFDALATLLRRFFRGENLTKSHKSHLYQRMVTAGASHSLVTSVYAFEATLGAVIALSTQHMPARRIASAVFVYVVLMVLGWFVLDMRVSRLVPG